MQRITRPDVMIKSKHRGEWLGHGIAAGKMWLEHSGGTEAFKHLQTPRAPFSNHHKKASFFPRAKLCHAGRPGSRLSGATYETGLPPGARGGLRGAGARKLLLAKKRRR